MYCLFFLGEWLKLINPKKKMKKNTSKSYLLNICHIDVVIKLNN